MISVWKGPNGRVGVMSGMLKPGSHDWSALLQLEGGDFARIDLAGPDSEVSLDSLWKRMTVIQGYRVEQMAKYCPECRQEVRR
jgi:hypothetical protein